MQSTSLSNLASSTAATTYMHLRAVEEKVSLFIYFFFQLLGNILDIKMLTWNSKNASYLKKISPFVWKSPPSFCENHPYGSDFSMFLNEYITLKKQESVAPSSCLVKAWCTAKKFFSFSHDDPISLLNKELKKGFCHGQVLQLLHLAQLNKSVADQVPTLSTYGAHIALFEILEIFRPTFQRANREDLLNILTRMQPQGIVTQKDYLLEDSNALLLQDLVDFQGVAVVRIYSKTASHTLLFNFEPANKRFGFFNPQFLSGYYEYPTLELFRKRVLEYAKAAAYPQMHVSFYPVVFHP